MTGTEPTSGTGQAAPALSDRDVALRFESLGGAGCGHEFGLFQRHYGAEPLGLLRWADISVDLLIRALEKQFDGVGAPENTIVYAPEDGTEWWTRDRRYWMAMRSFIRSDYVSREDMLTMACRRLRFLRGKLIEDLHAGGKILVYRNVNRNLLPAEQARLLRAIRAYGDATLFCLHYADPEHPPGTVGRTGDGILIGYADSFAFAANNRPAAPSEALLLSLCRQALALVGQPSAAATEPAVADQPRHQPQPPPSPQPSPPRSQSPPPTGNAQPGRTPEPAVEAHQPLAAPGVIAKRRRRIVLIGNCQAGALKGLYEKFVAPHTNDELFYIPSYEELRTTGRDSIAQADVVVEQILDMQPAAVPDCMPAGATRVLLPMVTAAFLWPFAGSPHPRNEKLPYLNDVGPYGGEYSDSALNRMILEGMQPEAAAEAWLNLDVGSRINLDRLHELVMDRQRARDEAAGYGVADVMEQHFRTEPVFLSPYHPNTRVAVALASQLFQRLGADPADIERMRRGVHTTPFPRDELPLHPAVCNHFGLTFVTPDRTYRHLNEGRFTAREFALRYMRYEFNRELAQGMHLLHLGKPEDARPLLEAALARSPASAAGHNALRHIHVVAGEPEAALAAARAAAAAEPDAGIYRSTLAGQLHAVGEVGEAEAEFRAAIALEPTEPHHRILFAHLLRSQGRDEDALTQLRAAEAVDPFSSHVRTQIEDLTRLAAPSVSADAAADALRRRARERAAAGALEEAADAATEAVRLRPHHAAGRRLRSDVLLRHGQQREAMMEALAAVVLDPRDAGGYVHLGIVLRRGGDPAGAEEAFRTAIALAPADAQVQHELSALLRHQKRFADALAAAERAASLEPDSPPRLQHLAVTQMDNRQHDAAMETLHRALALAPDSTLARIHLSDLHARLGRLAEALAEIEVAVARDQRSVHALTQMAHVRRLRAEPALAADALRRALAVEPENPHLRRSLAELRPPGESGQTAA